MTVLDRPDAARTHPGSVASTSVDATATHVPPSTTVPWRPAVPAEQRRRRTGVIRATDLLAILGALTAAATTTGLLWMQLSPFSGLVGYIVTTWVLFIIFFAILVSFDENRPTMRDRVASVTVHSLGLVLLAALIFVIVYTFSGGWHALVHANFFTQDMRSSTPLDPLTKDGITHAVVGTLLEVGMTLVIVIPLGVLGAVFLHEFRGPFPRFVRTIVEAMTALPDIVAGLFIYATLILILGLGYSGFAAACALAVTALPIVIRAGDVVLRLVPGGLIEASYALGSGQWRTVWNVLLPTVRSGLVTAVILGTARAIGETAPVLLTAGANNFMNTNPVSGPMMSLPLYAFTEVHSSQKNDIVRGFGAASVLLVLVFVLFAIARIIGGRGPGQLTLRQQRRRELRSLRDADRFANRAHEDSSAVWPTTGPVRRRWPRHERQKGMAT